MQLAWLKRQIQSCYPRGGPLTLAVCFFFASASLAQLADTRIAFMSTRSGNGEIHLMNPDGKRVRRLTNHPQYDAYPAWSPDGQQIVFVSGRDKKDDNDKNWEVHVKRKCKMRRETEFFLENSVSFFRSRFLLHDFLT